MLAMVLDGHGGPDRLSLREVPDPAPGPGEARVRVHASSINNTDLWTREGAYGTAEDPDAVVGWRGVPLSFPRIQGADVLGHVDAVGDGVDRTWLDRRVLVDPALYAGAEPDGTPRAGRAPDDATPAGYLGSERDGGFAQQVVVHAARLHDVTASPLPDAALAGLPCAYGTAMGMLDRAAVTAGEQVLVTGASGGVGMAAVGLATALGCDVVALTSTGTADAVRAAGARAVVDRKQGDVEVQVRNAAPELAAVVDVVGGPLFGTWPALLAPHGRIVVAGAVAGPRVQLDLRRLYLGQKRIIGSSMNTPAQFRSLVELAVRGDVQVPIAARFPLAELVEAQRSFREDARVGKIVIDIP